MNHHSCSKNTFPGLCKWTIDAWKSFILALWLWLSQQSHYYCFEAYRKILWSRTNQLHPCQGQATALYHSHRDTTVALYDMAIAQQTQDWWAVSHGICGMAISPAWPSNRGEIVVDGIKCFFLVSVNERLKLWLLIQRFAPTNMHWNAEACDSYLIALSVKPLGQGRFYPMTLPQS